jgi:hypothetical protein
MHASVTFSREATRRVSGGKVALARKIGQNRRLSRRLRPLSHVGGRGLR